MVDQDRCTRAAARGWARSARAVRVFLHADLLGAQLESVLATTALSSSDLVRLYRAHVDEWLRFPHPLVPAFLPQTPRSRMSA